MSRFQTVYRLAMVALLLGCLGTLGAQSDGTGSGEQPLRYDGSLRLIVDADAVFTAGIPQPLLISVTGTNERRVQLRLAAIALDRQARTETQLASWTRDADGTFVQSVALPAGWEGLTRLVLHGVVPADSTRAMADIEVTLQRPQLNTYIGTDKPLYQPGQVIHIRTLTFNPISGTAVTAAPAVVRLRNEEDVILWRRETATNDFGVCALDCQLSAEARPGNYRLEAEVGPTTAGIDVPVREYQLPKFQVRVTPDAGSYQIGEEMIATVTCRYMFGEPVVGANVEVSLVAFDLPNSGIPTTLAQLRGATDEDGYYECRYTWLEDYRSYLGPDGRLPISLRAFVVDEGGLTEVQSASTLLARQPIFFEVFPENGTVVPGRVNRLFMQASTPEGEPVQCALRLPDIEGVTRTSPQGLAVIEWDAPDRLTDYYESFRVEWATEDDGGTADAVWNTGEMDSPPPHVATLVRPMSYVLAADDTLRLQLQPCRLPRDRDTGLTALDPPVTLPSIAGESPAYLDPESTRVTLNGYLVDVRRMGQTLATHRVALTDATRLYDEGVAIPLPEGLFGQIDVVVHSIQAVQWREATDATTGGGLSYRVVPNTGWTGVFRDRGDRLHIRIETDAGTYEPGPQATPAVLRIVAERESGTPGPVILGVDVVDEAVYALSSAEREQVQLAFMLAATTLEDRLHRGLLDEALSDSHRDRLVAALIARSTPALGERTTVDSNGYPERLTWERLYALRQMVDYWHAYFYYRGQVRDPFGWLAAHADETQYDPDMRSDAWGNDLVLTEYLDEGWVILSPGPDGRFDAEDEDAPVNADNLLQYFAW